VILKRRTTKGKIRYGVRVDRNGEQVWVGTFTTLGEARTAEAKARTGPPRSRVTCDAYVDHWLEGYAQRAKDSSYETAESALSKFKTDWKGIPLAVVTRMEAEKWARENKWRVPVVVTLLNAAVKAELIDRNHFAGLSHKGPGRKHMTPLTPQEVDRLAAIAERLHGRSMGSFVTFAAYTALRVGEMYGLEWDDLDLAANRINVNRRVYRGRTDLPKSNRIRQVSLTPPAREALKGLDRSKQWVFVNKRGKRLSQSSLSYAFEGIRGAFGRHVTPHELKHFCGYYLYVILGLPDRVVAEQLGHSDGGKLVRELYGHGNVGALEEIDAAFANVVPIERGARTGA
jgi:integrase